MSNTTDAPVPPTAVWQVLRRQLSIRQHDVALPEVTPESPLWVITDTVLDLVEVCLKSSPQASVADDTIAEAFTEVARRISEQWGAIGDTQVHEERGPEFERPLLGLYRSLLDALALGAALDQGKSADKFGHALAHMRAVVQEALDLQRAQTALDLERRLELAVEVAERSASAAQESAGLAGTSNLAGHFDDYSRRQRKASTQSTALMLFFFAISIGLASLVVFSAGDRGATTAVEVSRLTLSVPLVLLGLYFGREAAERRRRAQHAEEIAVRLQSVRAYTEELEPDARHAVLGQLGMEVFSLRGFDAAVHGAESKNEVGQEYSGSVQVLAEVIQKLIGSQRR